MANRTGAGWFQPGNTFGRGRPRREVEKAYLEAVVASVPLAKWKRIVKKAVELALEGDAAARTWLGKLLCGDDPLGLIELVEQMYALLDAAAAGGYGRAAS